MASSAAEERARRDAKIKAAFAGYESGRTVADADGRKRPKPFAEQRALWEAMWAAADFSWDGLADAGWEREYGANPAQVLKRWRAPVEFPCGELAEDLDAAFREATLQDYWRWVPNPDWTEDQSWAGGRLASDDDLKALGLLVEVDGRLWHALHRPEARIDAADALATAIRQRLALSRPVLLDAPDEADRVWSVLGGDGRCILTGARASGIDALWRVFADSGEPKRALHVAMPLAALDACDGSGLAFGDGADFGAALFGVASFRKATFGYRADFRAATFGFGSGFGAAAFGDRASFESATFGDWVAFVSAKFGAKAAFGGASFGEQASFTAAAFGEAAGFNRVTFGPTAKFARATFGDRPSFVFATFGERAWFQSATFGDQADFDQTSFDGRAVFNSARFGSRVSFNSATFGDAASFGSATFGGGARFGSARFGDTAAFDGAAFGDDANFHAVTFGDGAKFENAAFGEAATFEAATFGADASFASATFVDRASFSVARFGEQATFDSATFGKAANFGWAAFGDGVWFGSSHFGADAGFVSATFSGRAGFDSAVFGDRASFNSATFGGRVWFGFASFGDGAQFGAATFTGPLVAQGIECQGRFQMRAAEVRGYADFSGARWPLKAADQHAAFEGCRFRDAADFRTDGFNAFALFDGAEFSGRVLLVGPAEAGFDAAVKAAQEAVRADHQATPDFAQTKRDHAEATEGVEPGRRAPKPPQTHDDFAAERGADARFGALAGGLGALKRAMAAQGDFDREQRFHSFEIRARMRRPAEPWPAKLAAGVYGVASDYGGSIGRPLAALAVVMGAFAVVYWGLGLALGALEPAPLGADGAGLPLLERFWHALSFSVTVTFLPFSALSADALAGNPVAAQLLDAFGPGWGVTVRLISVLQSLIAIVLAVLFALAVRRRLRMR